MSTKIHQIQLYQFKDLNFETFYQKYIYEISPHNVVDEDTLSVYHIGQDKLSEAKSGARNKTVVENKVKYLQDAIIRIANRKHNDRSFTLNAEILKSVIGKEYKTLLSVLSDMGYIKMGGDAERHWYYVAGQYSTIYTLSDKEVYLTQPFTNVKIKKYKDKTIQLLQQQYEQYTKRETIRQFGEPFLKSYIKSLKKISIEDEQGLNEYINHQISENPNTAPYYNYIINELNNKNKSIYRIDDSHRIYHVLTNSERNLKQYLNIKLSIDCKNSHPLLFNYFIFNKLNISISSSYTISSYIKSIHIPTDNICNNIYHNVGKYLRKSLIDNNIEIDEIAKMQDDELDYIYKTSNGLLWDEVCSEHPDMSRKEVKVAMFGAVFYSHSPVADRWNEYAKEFKKHYPTVFRLIGDWKRKSTRNMVVEYMDDHGLPLDKASASLSIAMMALEAEIFTSVLKRLYAKRWNAIHIHDCIIVPKTENKNQPTRDDVVEIMQDVYKSFGLSPTFD